MQSYVLWALMQEILVKELAAVRGSTAVSALESSAHFLCSRSERVHHRNFFPVGSKKKSRFVGFHEKKPLSLTLMEERGYSILFNFPIAWLCSLTPTSPHTQRHPRDVPSCDQGHFCPTWEHLMLFNMSLCFLLTERNQIVLGRFFKNQQLLWQDLLPQNLP